ncbi:hypothetical protein GGP41_004277 [Bipolaris sorokiniana]|uniref:F-box domain-containing protein n=1 Tax=Cochliobolus sativus TaxID=45130 RepID=A0A8H6DXF3_COCSA|nr:hypothetical protein GGP41_004277 [Bipolaris sorokiniana]
MGEMGQLEALSYLPTDVQLMVLDYVGLYPDILALCLTSKSWNLIATKVLYKNIVLDIRTRNGQLSLFRQCLEVGAFRHLEYARNLSLLDVPIFECNKILPNKAPWIHGERDALLLQILQSFPSNKLITFRYLSQLDLDPSIINLLQKQQQSIVDFQLSHGNFQQLVTPMTRRVTAGVCGDGQKTFGLVELAQTLPRLEKFALLLPKELDVFLLEDYWSRCSYSTLFQNKQIVSRELMFDGYLPGGFVSAIPHIFNLSHITRLSLYADNFWYWKPLFSSPELRNLTHFDFHSPDSFDVRKSMDFEDLFTQNQNLQHLSLHMRFLKTVPLEPLLADDGSTMSSYIWPLCPRLKSLSLFDLWSVEKRVSYFPSMASLDAICDELGALEQFGLRVAEIGGCLLADAHDRQKYVLGQLKPIGKLKNLKMLHLYQDRLRIIDPDQPRRNVAAETQQLATMLFQWAHVLCPDLEVLVWGRFTETLDKDVYSLLEDQLEREGSLATNENVERVPQQYYVKQVTRLQGGATHVTAIPFSRRRIQNEFPDLDLLACDTSLGTLDRISRDIVY